jgi:hypothetical protein
VVMYSLLTEFRDGDNIVTTMMEHNSNFVPWYPLCREILPRLGRNVDLRVARFDHGTGELDLDHLARGSPSARFSAASSYLSRSPVSGRGSELVGGGIRMNVGVAAGVRMPVSAPPAGAIAGQAAAPGAGHR